MSEQAENTQEDIQDNELDGEQLEDQNLDVETEGEEAKAGAEAETDEVEIVFEGEDEPASDKSVPLARHLQRVKKLTRKKDVALEGKTAAEHRAEMLEEELKLYQMKDQNKPKTRPKADEFDDDDSYDAALDEYYAERTKTEAEKIVEARLGTQQATVTQSQKDQKFEADLVNHYERSDTLKVSDYDETEANAITLLGDDIAKRIMADSDLSHILLYHFGKPANEAKALYYKDLITKNPVGGLMKLGGYANKLKAKPKHSIAPDPETNLNGGGQQTSADAWKRKIDAARDKVASGKMDMSKLLEIKKEARQAGVSI